MLTNFVCYFFQECSIIIGSVSAPESILNVSSFFDDVRLDFFSKSGEWDIVETRVAKEERRLVGINVSIS